MGPDDPRLWSRALQEDAGYVTIEKTFKGRRPLTRIRMTPVGRKAFRAYLETIGKLAGLGD